MFLKLDSDRPIILITNDDGIDSPGLTALARELSQLGQIVIAAPEEQRSAISHAITLGKPLRFFPYPSSNSYPTYSSNGTPADCVKFAVRRLLSQKPQLVVSGINLGPNTGTNILYSGTVAGAVEGSILGIPSLAVSLDTYTDPIFSGAAEISALIAENILKRSLPAQIVLNLNVPNLPIERIKGIRITTMGRTNYNDFFEDDRGGEEYYFWLKDSSSWEGNTEDSDIATVASGYASLTPLQYDLTHHQFLDDLKDWDISTNNPE